MRGKALGLLKEGETTIPEARLDKETKGLFCHMPGDGKAMRGLINLSGGENMWTMPENGTDTFPSSTDILKSLERIHYMNHLYLQQVENVLTLQ